MMLIGVDYHPSFQTIAFFVEETKECGWKDGDRGGLAEWELIHGKNNESVP